MEKTYQIVNADVQIKKQSVAKENIIYYIDGKEESRELYSINGEIVTDIRQGYKEIINQ